MAGGACIGGGGATVAAVADGVTGVRDGDDAAVRVAVRAADDEPQALTLATPAIATAQADRRTARRPACPGACGAPSSIARMVERADGEP